MSVRIDDVYENVENPQEVSSLLKRYFETVGSDPTTPEVNLQKLTARSPYQYYKVLPVSLKRNLDVEMLKALDFFRRNNRGRNFPERDPYTAYSGPESYPEAV